MRKLLFLPLLLLTACGGGEVVSDAVTDEPTLPVYCIREVVFLDDDPQGKVLLDMPGYPFGQTDKMQEISREAYNELTNIDACKSDDPRMQLKPSGIAWADGRDTDLDGNPL